MRVFRMDKILGNNYGDIVPLAMETYLMTF